MVDIVKSISPAPLGEDGLPPEIMQVETETDPMDLEIFLEGEDGEIAELMEGMGEDEMPGFDANLAEHMDEDELNKLASELIGDYDSDVESRKDWLQMYVEGIDLLGLKIEEKSEPWEGACAVHHPLLSEALVKFQAETMMSIFPAAGPVKTTVIGKETPEKLDAAKRVQEDMNFQLTEKMVEFRPETERMLWGLGLAGNAFKKVYFDPLLNRQTSMYLPAEDVVVPYGASNIETSERVTHVMRKTPNQVKKLQASGFYIDTELDEPTDTFDEIEKAIAEKMGFSASTDDRHKLLEMHVNLDIPDFDENDGVAVPYVITIEKSSGTVLALYRNWKEEDEEKEKRNHFVHYSYIPGFGFYAFGLVHLIGAFVKSGTSLIRQLVDAGTLSNLPGGFKTRGLRIKGDDTPIGPAEFRDVDVVSGTISDNILPLPYKEPSQVLYSLLNTIVEEGRRFASAADMKVSDMSSQSPVGTTLAILERSLKVMSAVQARIHYAMRQEFRLLKDIIRDFAPDQYAYDPEEGERFDRETDYELVDVIPVSDPNSSTMAQKVVQYQAVLQLAQSAPDLYDLPFLHREMLDVLGIKNADKLVPQEDEMKPKEPVSENMAIINGKPVKAFLYQDHESHIAVHMAATQDPKIAEMVGQSPQANAIMGAMSAHVSEHLAFAYRKQIEDQAGVPYPAPDAEMDEETELEVSRLAAAAAQQVLNNNKAEKAAQAAQQAQEDPIVQMQQKELEMQQKELEIKEKDSATKQQKIILDAAIKQEEISAKKEIEGMKLGQKTAASQADIQRQGIELGIKVAESVVKDEAQEQSGNPEER